MSSVPIMNTASSVDPVKSWLFLQVAINHRHHQIEAIWRIQINYIDNVNKTTIHESNVGRKGVLHFRLIVGNLETTEYNINGIDDCTPTVRKVLHRIHANMIHHMTFKWNIPYSVATTTTLRPSCSPVSRPDMSVWHDRTLVSRKPRSKRFSTMAIWQIGINS